MSSRLRFWMVRIRIPPKQTAQNRKKMFRAAGPLMMREWIRKISRMSKAVAVLKRVMIMF